MCGDEVEGLSFHLDFDAQHATAFRFTLILKHEVLGVLDRQAGKNGDSVFATLVIKVWSKRVLHLRHRRELDNLVFAFSPSHTAIHFLQSDEIRTGGVYDVGNALKVEFLVHADADVDVVSHDT